MPFREDLDAALAHAESAEQELRAAREQNEADHKRIAELEEALADAKRGVQQTKGRAPPADEPTQAGTRATTIGAALGRLQLRHAGVLVFLSSLIALTGATLVVVVPGHEMFLRDGGLLVFGLVLVYNFRKPTRRRILRGKIQGGFQWRDLRNLDLSQVELTQCELHDSDLRGATLEGSTFTQCKFDGADLRGARLDGATFSQCEFGRSNLRGATLDGATFSQCPFDGAQIEEVSVSDTTFSQCDLRGTAIAKGLEGATFEQCHV